MSMTNKACRHRTHVCSIAWRLASPLDDEAGVFGTGFEWAGARGWECAGELNSLPPNGVARVARGTLFAARSVLQKAGLPQAHPNSSQEQVQHKELPQK